MYLTVTGEWRIIAMNSCKIGNLSKDGEDVRNAAIADPDLASIQHIMTPVFTQNCS